MHKWAHEVEVGTKWLKKPYNPTLALYDKEGWVTHTVVVGDGNNPDGDDFTRSQTADLPTILAECGFCSKSEARRRGFSETIPYGYHERRVAANMVLSIWNV